MVELVFAIPGARPLLRAGRAAAGLHRDHGHHRVLRCLPGLHGDRGRSALRLDRSTGPAGVGAGVWQKCKLTRRISSRCTRSTRSRASRGHPCPTGRTPGFASRPTGRALISLYIVLGLLAFTLARPAAVDGGPRRAGRGSDQPAARADRSATIVAPYEPWSGELGAAHRRGPAHWRMKPTSEAVRLHLGSGRRRRWAATPFTAASSTWAAIGPSACRWSTCSARRACYFEDRLDLTPRTYHYSVIAFAAGSAASSISRPSR